MELLILIGRVMFGLLFLASAMGHLTETKALAKHAERRGVPNAMLITQLTGIAIALGAASVMLGIFPDLGALILLVFLLGTAVVIHRFWAEPEGEARAMTQTQFMKDIALAGSALVLFGVFVEVGDVLGYTVTGPLL